jgi:HAD superfamily hydrolase (TIGR01509 family)
MKYSDSLEFVFLDLDGVLVDSEQLKGKAHIQCAKELFNICDIFLDYRDVMGLAHHEVVKYFLRSINPTEYDLARYNECFWLLYKSMISRFLIPMPGARFLLQHLKSKGIGIATVTSSPQSIVNLAIDKARLDKYIDFSVSGNDTDLHKPHPSPYLEALKRSRIAARQAIAVEDTHAGLTSAMRAGIRSIALHHSLNTDQDFHEAIRQVRNLRELAYILS